MSALVAELWAWYGLTIFVIGARLASRRLLYGTFTKLGADDYIMVLVLISFTVLSVGVHILTYTPTNLIDPSDPVDLTPDTVKTRIFGSKMVIVVEQMQILTIWSVKACLLVMYHRLTTSLSHNMVVKLVAAYVAVGFIVMEVLFFGVWCRPFWHYWQVPNDSLECTAEHNHMITNAVVNISSDIMIIMLPMPIFIRAKLKLKRKLTLIGVFALGAFTILSAILNKYYSFSQTYGTEWIYWYIREAATAIIVANLPLTWTLLQRLFNLGSFHSKSSNRRTTMGQGTSRFRSVYGNLSSRIREETQSVRGHTTKDPEFNSTDSQEQINGSYGIPLQIYQKNEVHITTEAAPDGDSSPKWNATAMGVTFAMESNSHAKSSDDQASNSETEHGVVTRAYHEV
ncbi:hypothetical protein M406DRAFT_249523 [Cryphonectria parasitica EP155]|uniref:Rhodopsin domain-containing protein n=1 Tax=Cryphonectria parasitica (strain ATCC 38755 / EP155) TaxID=660469 RepID=A0A9P5CS85_CRYP1|nr:uncharacterized protein M406DRAFT_249523 [Cryphonectria parasitica EP155]KAF3769354.1 hypothetical protein M406DRAFT_249523 [Cryphonectria parasitica EP155]